MVVNDMEKINESWEGRKNTKETEILKKIISEELTDGSI